eukprot:scaffold7775_cov61-Cyclotella_meneghiniana.AAC.21
MVLEAEHVFVLVLGRQTQCPERYSGGRNPPCLKPQDTDTDQMASQAYPVNKQAVAGGLHRKILKKTLSSYSCHAGSKVW